jgi:hypothetical protein
LCPQRKKAGFVALSVQGHVPTEALSGVDATVEWVIGDKEGPACDTPIAGPVVDLLAREAAGNWPCISVWWRPVG